MESFLFAPTYRSLLESVLAHRSSLIFANRLSCATARTLHAANLTISGNPTRGTSKWVWDLYFSYQQMINYAQSGLFGLERKSCRAKDALRPLKPIYNVERSRDATALM